MPAEMIALRLVHILCGIFWVGSGLFSALFLAPALATSGVNAGALFAALGQRKLFIAMPVAALLTIGSGARLLSIVSGGFDVAYMRSATGRTLAWSGVFAILAFLLSLAISRPAAVRAGKLAAEGKADQAATARRAGAVSSTIALILLVLAAAGMSVARYVS